MTTLQYEPEEAGHQEGNAPTAEAEDIQETDTKIEEGKKEGKKVSEEHKQEQQDGW